MAKKREGLEQLLVEDLQDLFDAEKQLVRAIPKMAKAAADEELVSALRNHLEVTKGQVQRLEKIFESMDMRAKSKPCKGMKGIVEEGSEQLQEDHEESIMDSAISAAARKVEHYEMVGYESARALATQLGMREAAQLLDETLREEMQADKELAQISKRLLKESGRRQADAGGGSKAKQGRSGRGTAKATRRGSEEGRFGGAFDRSRRDPPVGGGAWRSSRLCSRHRRQGRHGHDPSGLPGLLRRGLARRDRLGRLVREVRRERARFAGAGNHRSAARRVTLTSW